ncbi:alpha/beta fold hydrolase [Hyphomonas sp. UBA4494]|jgi:pimeloyl-ACP methyl ester carboxylesterase/DNA-binding CsgD family transcriptional regulator|uniref:alpha/beta fold hydrolase n=1 Tax=Hyphomonas sp. UBA4494 TaxID=1946631 RepID=UPI0025C510D3|nr:alpha/beta fold hydrolase [Hyphomonas sp. UBA4494]
MSLTNRYFDMLGAAYEVPSEADRFDAFLNAAMAYFFEEEEAAQVAQDVPRHFGDDDMLDTHGDRISALIEEASRRETAQSERFHAALDVSARTGQVTGNAAAAQLTGMRFPCALDELPLDPMARAEIRKTMRSTEPQKQDRIILANVETPQVRACLGLIQRPKDLADRVHVSLSYIDWSEPLMERLKEAFGLTTSETEVLEGYLANLSQKEIAQQRGRALETIKGQSKSILRKTGCGRMSDVVQLCASIAFLMRQLPQQLAPPSAEVWATPQAGLSLLDRPGGRKLAWYKAGQGARAILFVHGYLQGPFFTQDFLERLTASGLHLVAPSRPGFGYTSPSRSRADFDRTVVEDAVALVEHLGLERISLCVHQGGSSHAFRIARALGDRLSDMLVVGGGIPIDEAVHLAHMDPQTKFAAMATRHAPSIMKMVMSVGLPVYRRRGTKAFLTTQFQKSPLDLATLKDPSLMKVQAEGLYHAVEQGAEAWIRDGSAAMADWSEDMDAVTAPQVWLQAGGDTIISADQVAAHMDKRPNVDFRILPGHAVNILHTAAVDVCAALANLA